MGMTIIEGLKQLRLIEKRIEKNNTEIKKYSSLLSIEKPYFESEAAQKQDVVNLIKSNHDLATQYEKIKEQIELTNLVTKVEVNGEVKSISSWLSILRKTGKLLNATYSSLSGDAATSKMLKYREPGTNPTVIRLYDENVKRTGQRKWEDLVNGTIEGRLEVVNATTELVELT